MIKDPKYLVKFTNAYNDNGTVWYTVQVIPSLLRSSVLKKASLGHSKNAIVACAQSMRIARRESIEMIYRPSLQENYLEIQARSSSREGKKSLKITTVLCLGQSISKSSLKS